MTPLPPPELRMAVDRGRPSDALLALRHAAAWADAVLVGVLSGVDPEQAGGGTDDTAALETVIALDDALTALTDLGGYARALAERAVVGPELTAHLTAAAGQLADAAGRLHAVQLLADAGTQVADEHAALTERIATLQPLAALVETLPGLREAYEHLSRRVGDGTDGLGTDAEQALTLAVQVVGLAGAATAAGSTT